MRSKSRIACFYYSCHWHNITIILSFYLIEVSGCADEVPAVALPLCSFFFCFFFCFVFLFFSAALLFTFYFECCTEVRWTPDKPSNKTFTIIRRYGFLSFGTLTILVLQGFTSISCYLWNYLSFAKVNPKRIVTFNI